MKYWDCHAFFLYIQRNHAALDSVQSKIRKLETAKTKSTPTKKIYNVTFSNKPTEMINLAAIFNSTKSNLVCPTINAIV